MKAYQLKILIFIVFLLGPLVNEVNSKVDPPNYNFSLDELELFYPGKPIADVEKKYGKGELVKDEAPITLLKFFVSQLRYKFPVFVQVQDGKILDFYAKLPTYFLHDVYHQSLINRFGKQNKYYKKEEAAVYIWGNISGNKIIYSGACTITCFPIYMTVFPANPDPKQPFEPIIKKFEVKTKQLK